MHVFLQNKSKVIYTEIWNNKWRYVTDTVLNWVFADTRKKQCKKTRQDDEVWYHYGKYWKRRRKHERMINTGRWLKALNCEADESVWKTPDSAACFYSYHNNLTYLELWQVTLTLLRHTEEITFSPEIKFLLFLNKNTKHRVWRGQKKSSSMSSLQKKFNSK